MSNISGVSLRLGIDTGGTFTDFVRLGPDGVTVHKLRSTPDDPSRAILTGIADLDGRSTRLDVIHGSTVATNAVLERKGARVALVATRGFEDVVRIGRQTRAALYDIFLPLPRPLLDPALTFAVGERLDARGNVLTPVDRDEVADLAGHLRQHADIAAVCLLHSYANPAHEREVAGVLRERGIRVCTSHEVLPEYREFERWSTTVANAYVTPLVDEYLARLESELIGARGGKRLSIMQSNGGTISSAAARAQAVRTVLSGPAAGVVGARAVAAAAGISRLISFDMGGTSTDVSLIDRSVTMTRESRVGDVPVSLPMLDIHTVGAGGGSIAAIDSGGALRVGPRSAGAVPGPACYGTGTELTVTDANLLLGRLDPDSLLGGRMRMDTRRAREVAAAIARPLKMSIDQLAEGIVRVANANMERAIRLVSIERGHDPRAFVLVAFGGAGGMHACEIAERLEMRSVLVPRHAGVLSALGMLMADVTKDYSASVLRESRDVSIDWLERRARPLVGEARRALAAEGVRGRQQDIRQFVDVRYVGQSYEMTVPLSRSYRRAFDREHARTYGYANPSRPTEVVNVRVVARGETVKPSLPFNRARRHVKPVPHAVRPGRFSGAVVKVAFFQWATLAPGARADGPAVITGGEATVVVPPGFTFTIDGFGNVVLQMPASRSRP